MTFRGGRKKKSIINPVKVKRIFAVTTLTSDNKTSQYVTERNQSMMRELEVPPAISENRKISVFVNPLSLSVNENSNDSFTEDDNSSQFTSKRNSSFTTNVGLIQQNLITNDVVLRNARRFKKSDNSKGSTGSLDESLFESVDSVTQSVKIKDKNEDEKKSNGEVESSSLDSITNSFASSSPEIISVNKTTSVIFCFLN